MTENHTLGSSVPSAKEIIEALIFASDEPLTTRQIIEIFGMLEEGERPRRISEENILAAIEELNKEFAETGRAFHIVKVAGGYQYATLKRFSVWLGKMVKERSRRKLSVSALESLAVIAYKQPVTKPEIEAIRGVNADYVMRTLLERNMVTIIGRAATPGRPLLYGTTRDFLKHFGLNDLSELPKPREIDELMAEAEFEVEKRMLADLEAKKAAADGDEPTDSTEGGSIVVSEDGTLREISDDTPPDVDELSKDPE
ncbi:MAG: Segregation and condensation protein [Bacteroidetes bacterium]|nr:Segregation and condensation protein [Bacteroidota bacterium]